MKSIRICVVGAGSSYTPELVEGILKHSHEDLPISTMSLCDINAERLGIMAGLADRTFRASGRNITVRSDTHLEPMLEGADFVITQIRVGGMAARYLDESIPLKYGVIGQETTGPGGMCKALRTIPPMLRIAEAVARVVPNAFILNYTNPSGIITEAVRKYTRARFVGLCSGIPAMQCLVADQLKEQYPDLRTYSVGLNHLGFIYRFVSKGKDVTEEALRTLFARSNSLPGSNGLAEVFRAVPLSYLRYYVHREEEVRKAQAATETRAQIIRKIEKAVFEEAARPGFVGTPEALAKRGGGGYSGVTFAVLHAILHDTGEEITVSVQNQGTVEGIPADAAVEVTCRIGRDGPHPIPVGPIPLHFRGLFQAVKAYETLTVEAAVQKSRRLALYALLNHPLVGDIDIAEPMLSELIAAHKLNLA